jgi:hypothetical protein
MTRGISRQQADADRAKSAKATDKIRTATESLLKDRGVHHWNGPPMAYFVDADSGTNYVYDLFDLAGLRAPVSKQHFASSYEEGEKSFLAALAKWLKPNRSLVWRTAPEVEVRGEKWAVYARCVQIDDDRHDFNIRWSL